MPSKETEMIESVPATEGTTPHSGGDCVGGIVGHLVLGMDVWIAAVIAGSTCIAVAFVEVVTLANCDATPRNSPGEKAAASAAAAADGSLVTA
jgi:hypothetical protein